MNILQSKFYGFYKWSSSKIKLFEFLFFCIFGMVNRVYADQKNVKNNGKQNTIQILY